MSSYTYTYIFIESAFLSFAFSLYFILFYCIRCLFMFIEFYVMLKWCFFDDVDDDQPKCDKFVCPTILSYSPETTDAFGILLPSSRV